MALTRGRWALPVYGEEGTGCSLHAEGPLQSPFEDCAGLGKGALKWAPVWGGRAWGSHRPGRRDSSKGSKVGWDLVARAPPLIPHIRCVSRGASERSPEGWNPLRCGRQECFFLSKCCFTIGSLWPFLSLSAPCPLPLLPVAARSWKSSRSKPFSSSLAIQLT